MAGPSLFADVDYVTWFDCEISEIRQLMYDDAVTNQYQACFHDASQTTGICSEARHLLNSAAQWLDVRLCYNAPSVQNPLN